MGRFYVHNFGCRATQADGAAIESQLTGAGLVKAESWRQAEVVVLNSCTVTAAADDDLRQTVRRVHRENPAANILVTGCYAQRAPAEIAALEGVRWVAGNSHKGEIAAIVGGAPTYHGEVGGVHWGGIAADAPILTAPVEAAAGDRTRPNLKIQDGCNNVCSFCIIPSVRGQSRSATPDEVVGQVRGLASEYREIVLSGINLGRWGRDVRRGFGMRLPDLLPRLLRETEVERIRLSSIEPMDWSDELMALVAEEPRIAPHVHAPLQSGCDATLKRMKRRYRTRHYASRLELARRLMPEAGIGADVMVGFPGETEAEFEESRAFIERMPFTYLHVFTYSERPGTPAAEAAGAVPVPERKRRNRVLRELAAAKNLEFRRRQVGRRLSVVTLAAGMPALSENYLKVELARPQPENRIASVEIGQVTAQGLAEISIFPILT